jgi:hypothetical protein
LVTVPHSCHPTPSSKSVVPLSSCPGELLTADCNFMALSCGDNAARNGLWIHQTKTRPDDQCPKTVQLRLYARILHSVAALLRPAARFTVAIYRASSCRYRSYSQRFRLRPAAAAAAAAACSNESGGQTSTRLSVGAAAGGQADRMATKNAASRGIKTVCTRFEQPINETTGRPHGLISTARDPGASRRPATPTSTLRHFSPKNQVLPMFLAGIICRRATFVSQTVHHPFSGGQKLTRARAFALTLLPFFSRSA